MNFLNCMGPFSKSCESEKIVRSSNGPTGDYAELLFSRAFSWSLEGNAASGHDATDEAEQRYQIKSRRITRHNGSRQLSFIRRLPDKTCDFLAAILFNADCSIHRAAILPHSILIKPRRSRFSKHANGWLFKLEDDVWRIPEVQGVTVKLKAAAATLGGADA